MYSQIKSFLEDIKKDKNDIKIGYAFFTSAFFLVLGYIFYNLFFLDDTKTKTNFEKVVLFCFQYFTVLIWVIGLILMLLGILYYTKNKMESIVATLLLILVIILMVMLSPLAVFKVKNYIKNKIVHKKISEILNKILVLLFIYVFSSACAIILYNIMYTLAEVNIKIIKIERLQVFIVLLSLYFYKMMQKICFENLCSFQTKEEKEKIKSQYYAMDFLFILFYQVVKAFFKIEIAEMEMAILMYISYDRWKSKKKK